MIKILKIWAVMAILTSVFLECGSDEAGELQNEDDLKKEESDGSSSDDDDNDDDETPKPKICRVNDHRAAGDGFTPDTKAIQKAIDECEAAGGGKVVFEPGEYLTGSIFLKSNIIFEVGEGVKIIGSKDEEDYIEPYLISAKERENIIIQGPGTIDGNGEHWYKQAIIGRYRPARLIRLAGSSDIIVRDIFLTNSPKWTLHLVGCDNALIERVKIRNPVGNEYVSPNSDGIDIEASRHIEVRDCDIETGDDCIVLKNAEDEYRRDSYDIKVHNCLLSGWANAFKIGTETERDFYNIEFRDSTIHASVESNPGKRNMGGVTIISDDGANVHSINIENVLMKQVKAPFFIRLQRRLRGDLTEPGRIYDISLKNITVEDASLTSTIMGIPEKSIENVTLSNISIVSTEGGKAEDRERQVPEREEEYPDAIYFGVFPAYGLYARHVQGLLKYEAPIKFSTTAKEERPAIVYDNVHKVDHSGLGGELEIYDRTGDALEP